MKNVSLFLFLPILLFGCQTTQQVNKSEENITRSTLPAGFSDAILTFGKYLPCEDNIALGSYGIEHPYSLSAGNVGECMRERWMTFGDQAAGHFQTLQSPGAQKAMEFRNVQEYLDWLNSERVCKTDKWVDERTIRNSSDTAFQRYRPTQSRAEGPENSTISRKLRNVGSTGSSGSGKKDGRTGSSSGSKNGGN